MSNEKYLLIKTGFKLFNVLKISQTILQRLLISIDTDWKAVTCWKTVPRIKVSVTVALLIILVIKSFHNYWNWV